MIQNFFLIVGLTVIVSLITWLILDRRDLIKAMKVLIKEWRQ